MAVSGLRALLPGTVSGHPTLPEIQRSLSENDLPPALGWHEPQTAGAAGRDRGGHRRALLSSRIGASVWGVAFRSLPTGAGHRRALLHPPLWLCHHAV